MTNSHLEKDRATLEAMGRIFCKAHHPGPKDASGLCVSCRGTVDVSLAHTESCPHGHVGNCQDCATHCQRGENRERIREIMRFAAPRMAFCHPLMAIDYLRKKVTKRK